MYSKRTATSEESQGYHGIERGLHMPSVRHERFNQKPLEVLKWTDPDQHHRVAPNFGTAPNTVYTV
eukprot:3156178-Heterocapsa_arctica.AAC.1